MTSCHLISVLVPAVNVRANIQRSYLAIGESLESPPGIDDETVFTDNLSADQTFELVEGVAETRTRVHVIQFSRNCGYQQFFGQDWLAGFATTTILPLMLISLNALILPFDPYRLYPEQSHRKTAGVQAHVKA